jgi:uncharacterized protein with HEPN domain
MAPAPFADRLRHMIDAIDRLVALWQGKSFLDYAGDPILAAASERFLEKVCEAAKYVPAECRSDTPISPGSRSAGSVTGCVMLTMTSTR